MISSSTHLGTLIKKYYFPYQLLRSAIFFERHGGEMVATAVRLPQTLRDRLSKAGGERGLGEEVRLRLEASFEADKAPADPKTCELLDAINRCAELTADDYGHWWDNAFSFEVIQACVNMLLTRYRPKGEAVPKPEPDGMHDLFFGPEYLPKPEELSRIYVSRWMSDRAKLLDKETRR